MSQQLLTDAIREKLRESPEGMTARQLAQCEGVLPFGTRSVHGALKKMPDAYIDRWVATRSGVYAAVWCVVVPPENCPFPSTEASSAT